MSGIEPNRGALDRLVEVAGSVDAPVVMLNLLKFDPDGGREAYFEYVKAAGPYVAQVGAEVLYVGKAGELVYGDDEWDVVMLVRYPSRAAFLEMINDPGYQQVHELREAALERAVLYATYPIGFKEM